MNSKELRQMIREEVRTEVLRALPGLIGEALNEVIATLPKPKSGQKRSAQVVKENKVVARGKTFDRSKLTALLGYGDLETPVRRSAPTPTVKTIAGVPMESGLAAYEQSMGVAHFRDYDIPSPGGPGEIGEIAEEYTPQFSRLPGGVDGGAEVPASIVSALGKRGKQVLDKAQAKSNWRPGMKNG